MIYEITHWSKPYLATTGKNTYAKESAAEAWELVQRLMASDEEVEIKDPSGCIIEWGQLKATAEKEAN